MEDKTFFNGRWKVVEEIGRGTTGTVYKAVNSRGGVSSYSAIKEILLPKDKKEIQSFITALRNYGNNLIKQAEKIEICVNKVGL